MKARVRELPSSDSLSNWLQWPQLTKAEPRSHLQGSQVGVRVTNTWAIHCSFPGSLTGSQTANAAVSTRPSAHMGRPTFNYVGSYQARNLHQKVPRICDASTEIYISIINTIKRTPILNSKSRDLKLLWELITYLHPFLQTFTSNQNPQVINRKDWQ